MKLALLADIHSNLEALTACLADAQARGAEGYAFLGDLVGYGADPCAVLDLVQEQVGRGAVAVLGNHDEAAALAATEDKMNKVAAEAIVWTRAQLAARHREFIGSLPLVVHRDDVCFVHASASSPRQWNYVTDPTQAGHSLSAAGSVYVFCGHVHEPVLYYTGAAGRTLPFDPVPGVVIPVPPRRQWLAIAGSVGQPRNGSPAARYALFDRERATLTFLRVPYDWRSAAAKIRAAGLPERLALRVEHGK